MTTWVFGVILVFLCRWVGLSVCLSSRTECAVPACFLPACVCAYATVLDGWVESTRFCPSGRVSFSRWRRWLAFKRTRERERERLVDIYRPFCICFCFCFGFCFSCGVVFSFSFRFCQPPSPPPPTTPYTPTHNTQRGRERATVF